MVTQYVFFLVAYPLEWEQGCQNCHSDFSCIDINYDEYDTNVRLGIP